MNNSSRIKEFLQEDLQKSGLTLESFKVEPLRDEEELQKRLGFTVVNGIRIIDVGGYWIPFPNVSDYYRLKLMEEIKDERGHKIKYLSPNKAKGKGNHVYIPVGVEELLKEYAPGLEIGLVEGEKKAQAATDAGIPTIGLPGIWNTNDEDNEFLPELEQCNWKDKAIKIVFDSDMTGKPQVKHAELRAAVKFTNRGAKVFSVRLPGDTKGADDYIVKYGKVKYNELVQQSRTTIELLISEDMKTETFVKEIALLDSIIEKERIIKLLSKHLEVPVTTIRDEMAKHTPKADKEVASDSKAEIFTEEEIKEAEQLLKDPDILSRMIGLTARAGYVGEEINQKMIYMSDTSRKLDEAISILVKGGSASGKSTLLNTIRRLMPKEAVHYFSAITAHALMYFPDDLSHKILLVQERHGSEAADYAIRTVISEGEISISYPAKNEKTGKFVTEEKRIPAVGLVHQSTTTDDRIHSENQTRVFDIFMDESPEQTCKVIKEQNRAAENPRDLTALESEFRKWRCAQTLLKPYTVAVPFAEKLNDAFPTDNVRIRRDNPRFLALIKTHALLYQYQRQTDEKGHLKATLDDLKGILPMVEKILPQSLKELTPKQEYVLTIIQTAFKAEEWFKIKDLQEKIKELGNWVELGKKAITQLNHNDIKELREKIPNWAIRPGGIKEGEEGELMGLISPPLREKYLSGKISYETLRKFLSKLAKDGIFLRWNEERGAGSLYCPIPGGSMAQLSVFSRKVLELLENNKVNTDLPNYTQSPNSVDKETNTAQENIHSEAYDCPKCCPIPKRNTNGRRPNNSIIRTINFEGKLVKLAYDKEAGTITVEREGKGKVLYDFEAEFEDFYQLGGFGN